MSNNLNWIIPVSVISVILGYVGYKQMYPTAGASGVIVASSFDNMDKSNEYGYGGSRRNKKRNKNRKTKKR